MFFTRTHTFNSSVPKEDLKNRLLGRHVKIHNLDFEVLESEGKLTIMPHAEQVDAIKTLPVTTVDMTEAGGKTKVVVKSKMRQLDSGGPYLIIIFCSFLFIAAGILMGVDMKDTSITYTLLGAGIGIFSIFWIRMEMGYFDYVRKVRAYVKEKGNPTLSEANMLVA
jgi:hypothetical protein